MAQYTPVRLAFDRYEAEDVDKDLTPVVFLHGLTAFKENWGDLPKATAGKTKRTVYAVDARNHGDSEWTDEFNFDCNVDDLLHFMDQREISRAILVGHSMGAITSFKTAIRAPERVEKIFAEDMTTKKIGQPIYDMITFFINLQKKAYEDIPSGLDEKEAKTFVVKHIYENMPDEMKNMIKNPESYSEDIIVSVKPTADDKFTSKSNLDVLLKALTLLANTAIQYEGVYEGPVSIAYGKLSPFLVGEDEELIKAHFPKVEMVCIEDATHTVHSDCPEEFNEALFNFLC